MPRDEPVGASPADRDALVAGGLDGAEIVIAEIVDASGAIGDPLDSVRF